MGSNAGRSGYPEVRHPQRPAEWACKDEVLSTLTAGRRAVVRPFDSVGEIEALLVGAGFAGIAHELDHRDVWFADEEAWWAWKWSYSLRGVLEQQDGE